MQWDRVHLSKVLDETKLMGEALKKLEVRAAIQREIRGLEIQIQRNVMMFTKK